MAIKKKYLVDQMLKDKNNAAGKQKKTASPKNAIYNAAASERAKIKNDSKHAYATRNIIDKGAEQVYPSIYKPGQSFSSSLIGGTKQAGTDYLGVAKYLESDDFFNQPEVQARLKETFGDNYDIEGLRKQMIDEANNRAKEAQRVSSIAATRSGDKSVLDNPDYAEWKDYLQRALRLHDYDLATDAFGKDMPKAQQRAGFNTNAQSLAEQNRFGFDAGNEPIIDKAFDQMAGGAKTYADSMTVQGMYSPQQLSDDIVRAVSYTNGYVDAMDPLEYEKSRQRASAYLGYDVVESSRSGKSMDDIISDAMGVYNSRNAELENAYNKAVGSTSSIYADEDEFRSDLDYIYGVNKQKAADQFSGDEDYQQSVDRLSKLLGYDITDMMAKNPDQVKANLEGKYAASGSASDAEYRDYVNYVENARLAQEESDRLEKETNQRLYDINKEFGTDIRNGRGYGPDQWQGVQDLSLKSDEERVHAAIVAIDNQELWDQLYKLYSTPGSGRAMPEMEKYNEQTIPKEYRNTFKYLWDNVGHERAMEFINSIDWFVRQGVANQYTEMGKDFAHLGDTLGVDGFWGDALNVTGSTVGSVGAWLTNLARAGVLPVNTVRELLGKEIDQYDESFNLGRFNDSLTGTVSQDLYDLSNGFSIGGIPVLPELYNAIGSGVTNAAAGFTLGPALAALGISLSGADTMLREGYGSDASTFENYRDAWAKAGLGALTEYLPLEILTGMKGSPLGYLAASAGSEGMEGMANELLNMGYDYLMYREDSPLGQSYSDALAKGFKGTEATWNNIKDTLGQLIRSGVSEGLGGLTGAAIPAASMAYTDRASGKAIQEAENNEGLLAVAESMYDQLPEDTQRYTDELREYLKASKPLPEGTSVESKLGIDEAQHDAKPAPTSTREELPEGASDETRFGIDEVDHSQKPAPRSQKQELPEGTSDETKLAMDETQHDSDKGVVREIDDSVRPAQETAEEQAPSKTEAPAAKKTGPTEKQKQKKFSDAKLGRIYREVINHLDADAREVMIGNMKGYVRGLLRESGYDGDRVNLDTMSDKILRVFDKGGSIDQRVLSDVVKNPAAKSVFDKLTARIEKADAIMQKKVDAINLTRKKAETTNATGTPGITEDMPGPTEEEVFAAAELSAEEARAYVAENVADFDAQHADGIMKMYNAGQNPATFVDSYKRAYQYGRDGRNLDVISRSEGIAGSLTDAQIRHAYIMGRDARINAQQQAPKSVGVTVGNVDTSGIQMGRLKTHQKAAVNVLSKFAKAAGFNIRFIESKVGADGKFIGENGSYDKKTRTITIDVNAGRITKDSANYAMISTAGHELTHYIKDFGDKQLYNAYQDFVLGHLSKTMSEAELNQRIEDTIAANKAAGVTLDRDGAIDEIVADASADVFSKLTEQDIRDLAEQNPKLLQRIKAFFDRWVKKMKSTLKFAASGQIEQNALAKQMESAVDELYARWTELLKNATENARAMDAEALTVSAQGGAKAKGIENYEPYVDQLKNVSVEDKRYMVGMGGIRKHSSNDFQIQNVQDYMLFFMDLAADKRGGVEWTGHTYTKNLDYARIFAPTNDRINVSIAMYGDNASGIRANTQEGVEWEELKAVRKKYKNVGAMAMVTNNDQLSFALNSDWIDMVIPFHASGMKRSLYYDVLAWTDYTSKQSERLYTKGQMIDKLRQKGIRVSSSAKASDVQRMFMDTFDVKTVYNEKTGKRVAPHFFPGETVQHGVTIPGHNNDAQRYFELCEQYGTNPRFFGVKVQDLNGNTIDVTQHPGYLKLIKETARTDTPQEPIVAKFDMDYINEAMKDFKGYANLSEDSYGIVDEFVREYIGKNRKVGYLTDRAQQYQEMRAEMAAEEADKRARQRASMLESINENDAAARPAAHESAQDGDVQFTDDVVLSARVTDRKTLDFLEGQKTIKTYRSMQIVDGKLYPPMAAVVAGSHEDASELGKWEMATEHPELVIRDPKTGKYQFNLQKGKGKDKGTDVKAAYNPYMHSSNLPLNDQFSSAYKRPNLVTVECEVPVSELTSGYQAQYAKDPVGWHAWHAGPVAGKVRKERGIERQVFLSRWLKPVRIIPDAEVAQMYREILGDTGIAVPDNVVSPSLLAELKKAGVPIAESGKVNDSDVVFMARGIEDDETSSIKQQIADSADILNAMEPVYEKNIYVPKIKKEKLVKWATKELAATGYRVERQNFGRIVFEEKHIDRGFDYLNTPAEYAAILAIPRVLKRGIEVREHTSHKYRKHPTKTFAAPVVINGVRGNMAVVVMLTSGNVYKTHRILMPDGSSFIYKENAEPTPARGVASNGSYALPIDSASDAIIRSPIGSVKDDSPNQVRDPSTITDREILANAMDSMAQTQQELNSVKQYRQHLAKLNEQQEQLDKISAHLRELRKDPKANRDEIIKEQNRQQILANQIDRYDKRILGFESAAPLRAVVNRQRDKLNKAAKARADQRLSQELAKERERAAELRASAKARADERLQKAVAKERERAERIRERGEQKIETIGKNKYRDQILKDTATLREWLTHPTNKAHVPEFLRRPLGDFIESIDMTSVRALNGGEVTKLDQKLTDSMNALRKALMNAHSEELNSAEIAGYLDLPSDFIEAFDDLITKIKNTLAASQDVIDLPVNRMTSGQMHELSKIIRTLNTSVRQMNRLLANARYSSAITAAHDTINEMGAMRAKIKSNPALEKLNSLFNWKNTTPIYAFQRFGKAGSAIFSGLQDGWDKLAYNSARIIKASEGMFKSKQVRDWGKQIETFELSNGKQISMTASQMMSLYCLSKREQAYGHLKGGGIKIAEFKSGRASVISQAENYTLTDDDIVEIVGRLSTEQRKAANAMQEYMSTVCAEWGNEISMARFGYRAFTEQNYFPIETDANNRRAVDEEARGSDMFRLLNLSATKDLTKNANNAIVIRDIFDVFTAHTADMAKYNALALPILDMLKWYNFAEKIPNDDGSFETETIQKALERVYGQHGKSYILNFIKDLNAEHDGGRDDSVFSQITNRSKMASTAANLRVAFLQITSLPRAAYVIDPKYLLQGLAKFKSLNPVNAIRGTEAQEKVGILKWKNLGFYSTDITRTTRELIKHEGGIGQQIKNVSAALAGFGDNWTTNILYEAAKAELTAKANAPKPGTAEFDKRVNDRVREIVYRTQVVDSTMTRSQNMRSKGIMSLFTAFMSEPTVTVNMLNEAVQKGIMLNRSGVDWKKTVRAVGGLGFRAMSTFVVSGVFSAVVEAIFDAMRDDDEFETFAEKWQESFKGNVMENMNPLAMIPILKEPISMLQGYSSNSMVTQVLDMAQRTVSAYDSWKAGKAPVYRVIYTGLQTLSTLSGFAVSNAVRDGVSIYNTFFADGLNAPRIQTYENTASDAANALYAAVSEGDTEHAKYIRDRISVSDVDVGNIEDKMRNLIKADYISGQIDESKARKWLASYANRSSDKIQSDMLEWSYERGTGMKYADLKQDYADGNVTKAEVRSYLQKYSGKTEAEIDEQIDRYDFYAATGSSDGYSKYWRMYDAFENGGNFAQYAKAWIDSGTKKYNIAKSISDRYKEQYLAIAGTPAGDRMLEKLLDLYEAIGYDREDERDYIAENWTED